MSTPNKNLQQTKNKTKILQVKKISFLKVPSNVNFRTGRALKPLIIILGPTASGKSKLALKLARKINGEIVSADSRQIFKKMLIATASPVAQMKNVKIKMKNNNVKFKNKAIKFYIINKIPHHLIHFVEPQQMFSIAEYKKLAVKIIRDIQRRGKIPILVGGTGLYISAIADNLEIPKVKPNSVLRKKLGKTPIIKLLKQLEKSDPATFKTIDKKNKRRIIRALEVTISTGKPFSAQKEKGKPLFDVLKIGVDAPRKKLYKKIDARVEKIIKNGLVQETKKLAKKYSWKLPSMSGIGYKQIGMHLRGEITLEKAKELIKFATHNYARRQMTWFRRDNNIHWVKTFNQTQKLTKKFLMKK